MPDPISCRSQFAEPTAAFDDEPLTCHAEPPALSSAEPAACLPLERSPDPAVCTATSLLVQNLSRSEPAVTPAPPPTSASPAAGTLLTVRPDQLDLQAGLPHLQARTALGGVQLTASVDVLNASAHLGSLNGDGSRGENIGAIANLLGGELNLDYRGWSLTLGVAASLGGSISSGDGRDLDGDGARERCFAMALGPFTLGECDEL